MSECPHNSSPEIDFSNPQNNLNMFLDRLSDPNEATPLTPEQIEKLTQRNIEIFLRAREIYDPLESNPKCNSAKLH